MTNNEMMKCIENHIKGHLPISEFDNLNENDICTVYDLMINNNENTEITNNIVLMVYYGMYHHIKQNYDLMEKYYLTAINHGNATAACLLGFYYDMSNIRELAIKYYSNACDAGYVDAFSKLIPCYRKNGNYQLIDVAYEKYRNCIVSSIEKSNGEDDKYFELLMKICELRPCLDIVFSLIIKHDKYILLQNWHLKNSLFSLVQHNFTDETSKILKLKTLQNLELAQAPHFIKILRNALQELDYDQMVNDYYVNDKDFDKGIHDFITRICDISSNIIDADIDADADMDAEMSNSDVNNEDADIDAEMSNSNVDIDNIDNIDNIDIDAENDKMIEYIKSFFKNTNLLFVDIPNKNDIQKIYDLLKNNDTYNYRNPDDSDSDIVALYFAVYYQIIKKNYDLAKKYYIEAIKKGNIEAIHKLAFYYHQTEKNDKLAEETYLLAVEKKYPKSMHNLGVFYSDKGKFDLAIQYFQMASDHGYIDSIMNLAHYYHKIKINYDLAKMYYLLAIGKGHVSAMFGLGQLYSEEKNYDLMKEYYLMAIDGGNTSAMINYGIYYETVEKNYNLAKKYFLMAFNHGYDKENIFDKYLKYCENESDYIALIPCIIKTNKYDFIRRSIKVDYALHHYKLTVEDLEILITKKEEELHNAPNFIKLIYKLLIGKINLIRQHYEYAIGMEGFRAARFNFEGETKK